MSEVWVAPLARLSRFAPEFAIVQSVDVAAAMPIASEDPLATAPTTLIRRMWLHTKVLR